MSDRTTIFRRKPPTLPRHPEAEVIADAIRRLSANPDLKIVLEYLKAKAFEAFANGPDDAGALLKVHTRITVIRELETLGQRVNDDERSDQHG